MSANSSNGSILQQKREDAETLLLQFNELLEALETLTVSEELHLKAGQLREISKSIVNLEGMKIPVPDELRNLKTNLLSEVHQAEEIETLFSYVETELSKLLARVRSCAPPPGNSPEGERRHRKRRDDLTPRATLRECIIKVLKSHGGSAKTQVVLDGIGDMLNGKLLPHDLDLDANSHQPIWRRNSCMEKRQMVRDGSLKDGSIGGYWEFSTKFAASLTK